MLRGKPYGGCAIFLRSSLSFKISTVVTNSRRVCAVLLESECVKLLCICVYMPYEADMSSVNEFQFQLSLIDSLLDKHSDCHILLGGDFNVDFRRNSSNTVLLNDYCTENSLFPVIRHNCSYVDYTHQHSMKYFSCIDHFVVSENLYQNAIKEQFVLHDVDNTSDHEPLCRTFKLSVLQLKMSSLEYKPRPSWSRANAQCITDYKETLRVKLNNIAVSKDVLLCSNVMCCNNNHMTVSIDMLIR